MHARALWLCSHPGPTLVVTALAVLLGIAAGLDAARTALLGVAVFAGQLSVGWSNDAVDAARDAASGREDKPIARGEISRRAVWAAAAVALAAAGALSVPLGAAMLAAHAITLCSAWSYNLGLKRTAFSVVPFVISFSLFPSLATLAAPSPALATPWAGIAGAALGIAVHFTNVIPDLDDDARTGVRGLPHRIGATAAVAWAFGAVEAGALAVLVGSLLAEPSLRVVVGGIAGFAVVTALAVAGLVRASRTPDRGIFRLVMLASLALALQLAVTGVSVGA